MSCFKKEAKELQNTYQKENKKILKERKDSYQLEITTRQGKRTS